MPISLEKIREGFEHVCMGGDMFGDHHAVICRKTGRIFLNVEHPDDPDLWDELPDDLEDEGSYLFIPDKRDLDLGTPLVFAFARDVLPDDYDQIRSIFNRKGAYPKFKDLLARRGAIDRWHAFENEATDRALRDWCALNQIDLVD